MRVQRNLGRVPLSRSTMKTVAIASILLAGCWRSTGGGNDVRPHATAVLPSIEYTISERGVGPIDEHATVTPSSLRRMFPGHRIKPRSLSDVHPLVYEAYAGDESLFYVVPADEYGPWEHPVSSRRFTYTVAEVFVFSSRIRAEERRWRTGDVLLELADLDVCRCWGDIDITACFATGKHGAVVFDERCDEAETSGPSMMLGKRISQLLWRRSTELDYTGQTMRLHDRATYRHPTPGAALPVTLEDSTPFIDAAIEVPGRGKVPGHFVVARDACVTSSCSRRSSIGTSC